MSRDQSAFLIDFLKSGAARCPSCRYDLRGAERDTCPECGVTLRLQLAARTGGQTIDWWLGLVGLIVTLIMTLAFLSRVSDDVIRVAGDPALPQMVRLGVASPRDLPDWPMLFIATGACIVAASGLACLLGARGAWTRWPKLARSAITLAAAASPLLYLVFLYLWVGR